MVGVWNKKLLLHKQNFEDLNFPVWCNTFKRQVLEYWFNFHSKEPGSYLEVIQENIQHNKFLKIGNKQLDKSFSEKNTIIKIADIIVDSNFMSKDHLETKMNKNISTLFYNSLICAIPQKWKLLIRAHNIPNNNLKHDITRLKKDISQVKARDIYGYFTFTKIMPSVDKWIEYYPFLESLDWTQLFRLPYCISHEPKVQRFQYSIINGFVICNYNLFLWRQVESNLCDAYHCIDSIEHFSTTAIRGHGGRVVTLSPPTSEARVRSLHSLKWENW